MHGQDGDDLLDRVTDDLVRLRKGRGLQTPDLAARLGPALAGTLDVDLGTTQTSLRRAVQGAVVEAAGALTADLREAVLVGLAVEGWSAEPLLTERIRSVARVMDRDARTARRRLDEATRLLADALLARRAAGPGGNAYAPPGWHVESLASVLRLDLPSARLTEDRVVVADVDGLDTVTATLSLPTRDGSGPDVDVRAGSGCRIRGASRLSDSYWRYELALPRPLRAGEQHRYVVSFSVPGPEALRPYYVLIPLRRTRRFSAEVRFAGPSAVGPVWLLDGVPQTVLEDDRPSAHVLRPDAAGSVRVRFDHVVQGLCYGIQWRWA